MNKVGSKRVFLHRSPVALLLRYMQLVLPLTLLYLWGGSLAAQHGFLFEKLSPQTLALLYRLLCAVWLIEMTRRYFNDLYVLADRNVEHYSGRLSLHLRKVSICYADIREIKVAQGVIGRLLHYGALRFDTAGGAGEEIRFEDIAYPQELSKLVQAVSHRAGIETQDAERMQREQPD